MNQDVLLMRGMILTIILTTSCLMLVDHDSRGYVRGAVALSIIVVELDQQGFLKQWRCWSSECCVRDPDRC